MRVAFSDGVELSKLFNFIPAKRKKTVFQNVVLCSEQRKVNKVQKSSNIVLK